MAVALRQAKQSDTFDPYVEKVRETNMTVTALIATVTFAAGFTMPGGFIQELDQPDKGSPRHNAAFLVFVITDTISFVLSTAAMLFQIFSSLEDNKNMRERFLVVALKLTMSAMAFMVIAFGTGTFAVLAASKVFAIVTLVIEMSFFSSILLYGYMVRKYDTKENHEQKHKKQKHKKKKKYKKRACQCLPNLMVPSR